MSLNNVHLIGNVGHDPELRRTDAGISVTNLSVATNEVYKDKEGTKQRRTEWHRIVVFGPQAESCATYLVKGRQVHVTGSLRTRDWTDGSGNLHTSTEIIARRVQFLDGPR